MKTIAPLLALTAALFAAAPAYAEEMPTAADVTERRGHLSAILDRALSPPAEPDPKGRTVVFLLDVTPALQRMGFPDELAAALTRNARLLSGAKLGIARMGAQGGLILAPTEDRATVVETARQVCARVDTAIQNVYADLRRILPAVRRGEGDREIVLVTLDNGDVEDDLEATVAALRRGPVRVSVIAREAFLSDAFWAWEGRPPEMLKGVTFTGSDNAFVELPWGFRFQWGIPNNQVLSGFAMYGLTRLAAATGGRVYPYYPPSGHAHFCLGARQGTCLFCDGDHHPTNEVYQSRRLRAIAPLTLSRREVLQHAMSDPYYRAVQRAWQSASRQDVTYTRPSIERSGGVFRIEPDLYRGWNANLRATVVFRSEVSRARRLVGSCEKILKTLRKDMEKAQEEGGYERYLAVAETTRLMFEITRFNLLHYVAWCQEVGPVIAARNAADYEPPEVTDHAEDLPFRRIHFENLSLCHGIAPYRWIRLPGGEELDREFAQLELSWNAYEKRWAHTPYLAALRRFALARFRLVQQPGAVPAAKGRVVPDSKTEEQATQPARPGRSGAGSSSEPGSRPTSGGGR